MENDWLGSPEFQNQALSTAMWWFLVIWLGAVGGCVGSFLTVCWDRRGSQRGIVFPPSQCDECGEPIRWYDNIPVVGWLMLRGRCRECGFRIPVKHLVVESFFVVLFMLAGVLLLSSGVLRRWL
jgi:leader peptidase (prepilin peptidase)/N-methyltransferase